MINLCNKIITLLNPPLAYDEVRQREELEAQRRQQTGLRNTAGSSRKAANTDIGSSNEKEKKMTKLSVLAASAVAVVLALSTAACSKSEEPAPAPAAQEQQAPAAANEAKPADKTPATEEKAAEQPAPEQTPAPAEGEAKK